MLNKTLTILDLLFELSGFIQTRGKLYKSFRKIEKVYV